MIYPKTYICVKCGKSFTKMAGGITPGPKEHMRDLYPVCDKCKLKKIEDIFGIKR